MRRACAATKQSKYPSAKPGALKLELLEAAGGVANAAPNSHDGFHGLDAVLVVSRHS